MKPNVVLFACAGVVWAVAAVACAATSHRASDVLVGVGYFAGWWQGSGDKWFEPWNATVDWRPLYPGRVPLLGDYNTQRAMDAEIQAAAAHGVDFWQILYYDPYPAPREPNAQFLNRGISNFMASPNAHLMHFMITWCNSLPTYGVTDDAEWNRIIVSDWIPAFRHPSYLRAGGRIVFRIINAFDFYNNCNQSAQVVTRRIEGLRQQVRDAGLGEMIIGAGMGCFQTLSDPLGQVGYAGYNFTSLYACVPAADGKPFSPFVVYPWSELSSRVRAQRLQHVAEDALPFEPVVMSGWDPRPWREPRESFKFPNMSEWVSELRSVKADLLNGSLGLGWPLPNGSRQAVFNAYSWNEFGEGGIIAPSAGWQYERLQGIQQVFGDSAHHNGF